MSEQATGTPRAWPRAPAGRSPRRGSENAGRRPSPTAPRARRPAVVRACAGARPRRARRRSRVVLGVARELADPGEHEPRRSAGQPGVRPPAPRAAPMRCGRAEASTTAPLRQRSGAPARSGVPRGAGRHARGGRSGAAVRDDAELRAGRAELVRSRRGAPPRDRRSARRRCGPPAPRRRAWPNVVTPPKVRARKKVTSWSVITGGCRACESGRRSRASAAVGAPAPRRGRGAALLAEQAALALALLAREVRGCAPTSSSRRPGAPGRRERVVTTVSRCRRPNVAAAPAPGRADRSPGRRSRRGPGTAR